MDPTRVRTVFVGRSGVRAGWRLLAFLVAVQSAMAGTKWLVALLFPTRAAAERASRSDDPLLYLIREVTFILILLGVSWIMGRSERRSLADYGLPWRQAFRRRFWQGVVLGFATLTLILAAMRAAGAFRFGSVDAPVGEAAQWALIWAMAFLLIGLYEEFAARGYGLYTLTTGVGFWPAAIASSALFAYWHHNNVGEDWLGLMNVGLFGLFACFLLRRTGDLWMPIGVHAAFDWGETYFYGVANSGAALPHHLLNGLPSGPPWLSGGSVGPEGSVFGTVVLCLVWLACNRWLPEARYPVARSMHHAALEIGA